MKRLEALFKIYKMDKVCVRDKDNFDIVILNKNRYLNLNDYINLVTSLKEITNKKINFISKEDAFKLHSKSEFKEYSYERD